MPNAHGKTAVYWHRDKSGQVLYVGASGNPHRRMMLHASASTWATQVVRQDIRWFNTREEALAFEAAEIQRLKPPHNKEWRPRVYPRWTANEGHVFLKSWMDQFGVTIEEFARRSGFLRCYAKVLTSQVKHIQIPKATLIAVATDGFVPRSAWDRTYGLSGQTPIITTPTADAAEREALLCVSLLKAWGKPLPPHAQTIIHRNLPATHAAE